MCCRARRDSAGSSAPCDEVPVVILVNVGKRVVGVVVDSVRDVIDIDQTQIGPVPECSAAADIDFITGIGSAMGDGEKRMLILIDVEKFVFSPEINLLELTLQ